MAMISPREVASWPEGHKPCRMCKVMKPFSEYHKHKSCLFGINTVCKECRQPLSKATVAAESAERKLYNGAKARAKNKGLAFDLEVEDIHIPEVCPILKIPLERNNYAAAPSLDRIRMDGGYTKDNVQVISNKANMMKNNATDEELKLFAEWVVRHQKAQCEIIW